MKSLSRSRDVVRSRNPVLVLGAIAIAFVFGIQIGGFSSIQNSNCEKVKLTTYQELDTITNKLLGPDEYGAGCPENCGCPETMKDCPRHYDISLVKQSANVVLDKDAIKHLETELESSHIVAAGQCSDQHGLETGGWCLGGFGGNNGSLDLPDGRKIQIPNGHVEAAKNIVITLLDFFKKENVKSISDYGAGVGQYGAQFKKAMPELLYYGYDGAGDVEAFTSGFLRWSDLSKPLNNPVTDWVMSLEVGEHVPSKYEGVLVRNLHRHNCKGVILSWGTLGQQGLNHINDHSNEYVSAIFEELGYQRDSDLEALLRREQDNYGWFTRSMMVFRRENPVC